MSLNFGGGNLFSASLEDGQVLFSDGSRNSPAFATLTKASGTLSILAGTDGYDTAAQFADIPFIKNELGVANTLEIQVWYTTQNDTDGVQYRIDIEETTSNPTGTETSVGPGDSQLMTDIIVQSPDENGTLIMRRLLVSNVTPTGYLKEMVTGDTNVFTTKWTLRLNFKNSTNGGTGTTKIRYLVMIHHS